MVSPIAVSALGIVLLVVFVVIVLLAAGGYVSASRRARQREVALRRELEAAERAFAQARALDKGWDRDVLADAARAAVAARFGDAAIGEPLLVQVLDRPGTEADQAIFHVETSDGAEHRMTLGRSGGEWGAA
jgi:type II secretory pathway pseudopilin PulG